MNELTRRRAKEANQETWYIYYGDVQVGTIGRRAGVPVDVDQWGWSCGFFPPAHLGSVSGTAPTFDEARAAFEDAWRDYLPNCREADFEAWRYQRAHTSWKYAMWDAGRKMPTQTVDGRTKCFCGAPIGGLSRTVPATSRRTECRSRRPPGPAWPSSIVCTSSRTAPCRPDKIGSGFCIDLRQGEVQRQPAALCTALQVAMKHGLFDLIGKDTKVR